MPRLLLGILFATFLCPSATSGRQEGAQDLLLELRIFNGAEEVTGQTRVFVHRAGDRGTPLAEAGGGPARIELKVPQGIYDVQAVRERDGQVVNIQWANRLVVMPYPDESGRHLEVLNFRTGFGALQIRGANATAPDVSLHPQGEEHKSLPGPAGGEGYALFVVPAGVYDVTIKHGTRSTRHSNIEVPRDRTRLWLVPTDRQSEP
jgi:hypothetical protein